MRDSLAQTLNTDIMETIQKLDRIGRDGEEGSDHLAGQHVAQVRVTDSGVCSDESEGSSSPQYRSWRSGPASLPLGPARDPQSGTSGQQSHLPGIQREPGGAGEKAAVDSQHWELQQNYSSS